MTRHLAQVAMRTFVLAVTFAVATPAFAQPAAAPPPAVGSAAPTPTPPPDPAAGAATPTPTPAPDPAAGSAAPTPAPVDPAAVRPVAPPVPPPAGVADCRLAGPPPKPEPGKPVVATPHSPMRQVCEDELIKDHDWWWNLEERLRKSIHRQAAREITTNNRHVVAAYGAMWLLAVGFIVLQWRRQQALKAEIVRLGEQLARIEAEDAKRQGGGKS